MKTCTIHFKFGETEHNITVSEDEFYGVEGERSLPTWDFQARLAQVLLKNKSKWNEIKRDIIQYLKDNSSVSQMVSYSKISGQEGLVPNVNYKYIQETFPEIDFPSIDVPILLLDNILDGAPKVPVKGRVIDKKGKEIFVVRNDKDSLVQLANYLQIREKVLSGEYKQSLDEELSDMLGRIAEKKGLSPEETILSYLNNTKQEKQKEKGILEGASIYTWMTYIASAIKGNPSKKKYKNTILNEFNKRLTTNKNGQQVITISELTSILSQSFPHLFGTQKDLIEVFNKRGGEVLEILAARLNTKQSNLEKSKGQKTEVGKSQLNNELDFYQLLEQVRSEYSGENDIWGFSMLFNAINRLLDADENPLALKAVSLQKDKLILEKIFPSLESAYGFGYETVASFTKEEERNGYYIYSQAKEVGNKVITYYYVTPYFINEKLNAQRFSSIDAAQEWIDSHYITQNLRKSSLINLKQRYIDGGVSQRLGRTFESLKFIPEGTIFSAIDMPLDIRSTSMKEEEYDLLDKTLQDFYNYIETLELNDSTKSIILSKINTSEKAVIFLSELNRKLNTKDDSGNIQYLRTNNDKVRTIVNEIDTKPITYYYVTNSYKVDEGKYRIRFTETDVSSVTDKRYNKRTPILQLLNSIAKVMNEKFGVPVNIINEQQLTEMGIEDMNLVKAFIKDGQVYINSAIAKPTDAFHEYAHLFLGALKANPEYRDSYIEFIDKILSTERGQKAFKRKKAKFPNSSDFDLAEETVADLYGEYMEGNLPYELSQMFAMNDKIKELQDTIFDRKDKGKSIVDFKGSLENIWRHFNSDVTKMMSDNINFIKENSLQIQRQKDNWIKDQISKGNIIEDCK